jgi:hypothetical protein
VGGGYLCLWAWHARASVRRDSGARFYRRQEGIGGCSLRMGEAAVGLWRGADGLKVKESSTSESLREQNMVRAAPPSENALEGR